jgi:hypothetical protein
MLLGTAVSSSRRRVIRNIEVDNMPARMFRHNEYIQHLEGSRDHRKEIAGNNLLGMIL